MAADRHCCDLPHDSRNAGRYHDRLPDFRQSSRGQDPSFWSDLAIRRSGDLHRSSR